MVLSYSRFMYAEIVFDQSVKTFILCHLNAFRYFGGVPYNVKIDNLKAAILKADFYEPLYKEHIVPLLLIMVFFLSHAEYILQQIKGKLSLELIM